MLEGSIPVLMLLGLAEDYRCVPEASSYPAQLMGTFCYGLS